MLDLNYKFNLFILFPNNIGLNFMDSCFFVSLYYQHVIILESKKYSVIDLIQSFLYQN